MSDVCYTQCSAYRIIIAIFVIGLLGSFAMDERPLATGKVRATRSMLSKEWELQSIKDIRYKLSMNDRFVPVIGSQLQRRKADKTKPVSFLEKRTQMFDLGLYPGIASEF